MSVSKTIFLLICFLGFWTNVSAQKYSYDFTITSIVYNGEPQQLDNAISKKGFLKKSTDRLLIAPLNDGSNLYAEIVITTEGVMLDKYTVVQIKYYTRKKKKWTLFCVSQRRKFKNNHVDKGTFGYNDPNSNESLSLEYSLIIKN